MNKTLHWVLFGSCWFFIPWWTNDFIMKYICVKDRLNFEWKHTSFSLLCIHFLAYLRGGGATVARAPHVGYWQACWEALKNFVGWVNGQWGQIFAPPFPPPSLKETIKKITKTIDSVQTSLDKKILNLLCNQVTMIYIRPVRMK